MNSEEAMQCALGYAWGREDASGTLTTGPAGLAGSVPAGSAGFAAAYAQGWDEFNSDRRGSMTSVASAYDRWQATRGATIFSKIDAPAPSQETGKHAAIGDIVTVRISGTPPFRARVTDAQPTVWGGFVYQVQPIGRSELPRYVSNVNISELPRFISNVNITEMTAVPATEHGSSPAGCAGRYSECDHNKPGS